jgi:hypothetical protein
MFLMDMIDFPEFCAIALTVNAKAFSTLFLSILKESETWYWKVKFYPQNMGT